MDQPITLETAIAFLVATPFFDGLDPADRAEVVRIMEVQRLQDGEEIEGTIEWYDRSALKVNRKSAPNLLVLKHNVKYMYKAEERVAQ